MNRTVKKLGVLLVDDVGQVTSVVQDHVEGLAILEVDGLLNAPDVLLVGLTLPGCRERGVKSTRFLKQEI